MTLSLLCVAALAADLPDPIPTTPVNPTNPEGADDWLIAFGLTYGGYAGAETGWLLGEAAERTEASHTTQGLYPGLIGGGAVGLSTAYLLDRSRDVPDQAEALLFTTATQGGFYGVQTGRALIPADAPGAVERTHAAGLAGSMIGVGLGVGLGERAAPIRDQLRFDLASGVGWVTATGISDVAGLTLDDPRPRAGIAMATTAAFGGLGILGNHVARPGFASTSLAVGQGLWIGAWSPLLFTDTPETREITGGLRLGLGVGYAGSLLLAAAGEPDGRSAGLQVAGWAAGTALGAGIPLSMPGRAPASAVVAPMLGAGLAGQALGAVLAPRYDLDPGDALLLGTLGAWTSYQAIGWGAYASYTTHDARRPFGYALTAAGAGSLATIGLLPILDVPPEGSMTLLSAGGWGTWYGGWSSQLLDLDPEQTWLVTLGAGDGALLASGLAQGVGWRPRFRDLAAVDGLGLMGAAGGGLLGVVFLYDPHDSRPLVVSSLAGSTVGLAAGTWLASMRPEPRQHGEARRLGPIHLPRVQATVSALPLAGADGQTGAIVRLDGHQIR